MGQVRNNPEQGRYELDAKGGEPAFAAYERNGRVVTFTHTIVPPADQGHGVASTLIKGALADVRAQGLRIVPQCVFVAAYLERHPEERDLLA